MKKLTILAGVILIGICSLAGCTTALQVNQVKETEKPPETTVITYRLPTLEMSKETSREQTQGNITASCSLKTSVTAERRTAETRSEVPCASKNTSRFEISSKPYYQLVPDSITFSLAVQNNGERILHFNGTILTVEWGNKPMEMPKEAKESFMSGYVRKDTAASFDIGPFPWKDMPDNSIIRVCLDDVIIKTDEAGNAVKRGNFEWKFVYRINPVTKNDTITYRYEKKPWIPCDTCQGRGRVAAGSRLCTYCNGSGKKTWTKKGKTYTDDCSYCGGDGRITETVACGKCGGTGYIK